MFGGSFQTTIVEKQSKMQQNKNFIYWSQISAFVWLALTLTLNPNPFCTKTSLLLEAWYPRRLHSSRI